MRKLSLELDSLDVQSFEIAAAERGTGTVEGHAPTKGANTACGSAYDACPTGFCATIGCETAGCETYDAQLCPSAVDACPSQRGCSDLFAC